MAINRNTYENLSFKAYQAKYPNKNFQDYLIDYIENYTGNQDPDHYLKPLLSDNPRIGELNRLFNKLVPEEVTTFSEEFLQAMKANEVRAFYNNKMLLCAQNLVTPEGILQERIVEAFAKRLKDLNTPSGLHNLTSSLQF